MSEAASKRPWWHELNRYHWFVLVVAALGWLFDTMDQQLFALARTPAMQELLSTASPGGRVPAAKSVVDAAAANATAVFLIGWATGGIAFGILGDRIGRARTMLLTILVYSVCTGFSALSSGYYDFLAWRFLTGLGVGGEFAVGVSLVAEVMPARARPYALGLLQALSAVGNISAALINIGLGYLDKSGQLGEFSAWRVMFVIGTVPALLALVIRRRLKEPEAWQTSVGKHQDRGNLGELFGPQWQRRAVGGVFLASAGVIGLWGIGFFSFDLLRSVFTKQLEAQGIDPVQAKGQVSIMVGVTSIMQNLGGFLGIYAFTYLTGVMGRRPAFALSFVAATGATALVFSSINDFYWDVFWMIPLMGFCQLALFGGYAIYFPELFPTRLRSTGTSFCYNVGRFVAAVGPFVFGTLTSSVFADKAEPARWAGVTMCSVFLLGLLVLPLLPETKDRPLPE
ncbi:MAG: MFS transporter [Pirellulales bacterium]|nr:MFS transporter [Pirellulales bacterium]